VSPKNGVKIKREGTNFHLSPGRPKDLGRRLQSKVRWLPWLRKLENTNMQRGHKDGKMNLGEGKKLKDCGSRRAKEVSKQERGTAKKESNPNHHWEGTRNEDGGGGGGDPRSEIKPNFILRTSNWSGSMSSEDPDMSFSMREKNQKATERGGATGSGKRDGRGG